MDEGSSLSVCNAVHWLSDLLCCAQTKRSASSNVDVSSDSEADHHHADNSSSQQPADHTTTQQPRQSRDHFKRAKADNDFPPESYVAALSLKNDDGDGPSAIGQKQSTQQLRLSEVLLQRGKRHEALRLLAEIIAHNPSNADALYLRGQCFAAENNSAGVRCSLILQSPYLVCMQDSWMYHSMVTKQPVTGFCLWPVACSLSPVIQSLLCMLQAFASFAAAVAVQPLHAHALVACAAIYRNSGQLDNAVSALETAAAAAPADAAVQQAYAAGLNAVGKLSPWPSSIVSGLAKIARHIPGCITLALRSMTSPLFHS